MALENSDLFIVQKQTGDHRKATAEQVTTFVSNNSGSIRYRGLADLTSAPSGQLNPSTPVGGDMYINDTAGTIDSGWAGISGTATEGDRIVYNAGSSEWDLVPTASTSGVMSVRATAPATVNTTDAANPIVGVRAATTATDATASGHVARLAVAADVAAGSGTSDKTSVVTADLLTATNDTVATKLTTANLSADLPLSIDTSTAGSPKVQIRDATTAVNGAVKLSTGTEASDGTSEAVGLTPKGAADNYTKLDFSSYTEVDPLADADVIPVFRPGAGNRHVTGATIADKAPVQSVNGSTGTVNLGIDDLSDVDTTTTAPGTNAALIWDGTNWVPGAAGSGIATVNLDYTAAADNGTVTCSAGTNATLPLATTTNAGLLAPADKTKLDGLDANGRVNLDQVLNEGNISTEDIILYGANTSDALVVSRKYVITATGGDPAQFVGSGSANPPAVGQVYTCSTSVTLSGGNTAALVTIELDASTGAIDGGHIVLSGNNVDYA